MKNLKKIFLLLVLCLFLAVVTIGCEKGPAEEAGKKVDDTVQSVKEAAKDATD